MGESSDHKAARQQEQQNAQQQLAMQQQNFALQQQIYGQISPFAQGLLQMGQNAQKGIAPDSFQLGTRNAIAGAFGQQRQNLTDFLGQSGQGFSGLAAGPAANLGAQESTAMGQSYADALNQALGLGMQGGNMLQGQQAIFNPTPYGQIGTQGLNNYTQATPMTSFGSNLLSSLLQAGIGAGSSFLTGGMSNILGGGSFLGGAAGGLSGGPSICWIAETIYGKNHPNTHAIRRLLLASDNQSIKEFVALYREQGEESAQFLSQKPDSEEMRISQDNHKKYYKSLFDDLLKKDYGTDS